MAFENDGIGAPCPSYAPSAEPTATVRPTTAAAAAASRPPTKEPTPPTPSPSLLPTASGEREAQCAANPSCAARGLTGACCPTVSC